MAVANAARRRCIMGGVTTLAVHVAAHVTNGSEV